MATGKNALVYCAMKRSPLQRVRDLSKTIGYSRNEADQILTVLRNIDHAARFLTLFVLYRHLENREKIIFTSYMHKLPNGSILRGKTQGILGDLAVQPLWNKWSISDGELEIRKENVGKLNDIFLYLGIADELGIVAAIKDLVPKALRVPLGVASFLVFVADLLASNHLEALNDEIERRARIRRNCSDY